MSAGRRVEQITRQITSTRDDSTGASLGTLRIGPHSLAITPCEDESRLPRSHLLDPHDPYTAAQLSWLLSIYLLKRDVFLISAPGPYARRLVVRWSVLACSCCVCRSTDTARSMLAGTYVPEHLRFAS